MSNYDLLPLLNALTSIKDSIDVNNDKLDVLVEELKKTNDELNNVSNSIDLID